jgi:hypothetical protein
VSHHFRHVFGLYEQVRLVGAAFLFEKIAMRGVAVRPG